MIDDPTGSEVTWVHFRFRQRLLATLTLFTTDIGFAVTIAEVFIKTYTRVAHGGATRFVLDVLLTNGISGIITVLDCRAQRVLFWMCSQPMESQELSIGCLA
jgi:hypothetical protein